MFEDDLINGIPLTVVVVALVEWLKSIGIYGKMLRVISLVIGLILGAAYQYSITPPIDISGWIGIIVYGLMLGLVSSGIYDAVKSAVRG